MGAEDRYVGCSPHYNFDATELAGASQGLNPVNSVYVTGQECAGLLKIGSRVGFEDPPIVEVVSGLPWSAFARRKHVTGIG